MSASGSSGDDSSSSTRTAQFGQKEDKSKPRHEGGVYDYRLDYFDLVVIVALVILLMPVVIIVK